MDDQSKIPMTPFDTLISTPGLRMMKLMIPYLPPSNQRMINPNSAEIIKATWIRRGT